MLYSVYSALQCSVVKFGLELCIVIEKSVQCSALRCSTVQYSAVQCSAEIALIGHSAVGRSR